MIKTNVTAKQENGEGTLRSMVDAMKPSVDFVPEQERNFDAKVVLANTSPYVFRGHITLDGKRYSRWS